MGTDVSAGCVLAEASGCEFSGSTQGPGSQGRGGTHCPPPAPQGGRKPEACSKPGPRETLYWERKGPRQFLSESEVKLVGVGNGGFRGRVLKHGPELPGKAYPTWKIQGGS